MHRIVPLPFEKKITEFYVALGEPVIDRESAWDLYHDLLAAFQVWEEQGDEAWNNIQETLEIVQTSINQEGRSREDTTPQMALLSGLQELPFGPRHPDREGNIYLGGRTQGWEGLGDDLGTEEDDYEEVEMVYADFSDAE